MDSNKNTKPGAGLAGPTDEQKLQSALNTEDNSKQMVEGGLPQGSVMKQGPEFGPMPETMNEPQQEIAPNYVEGDVAESSTPVVNDMTPPPLPAEPRVVEKVVYKTAGPGLFGQLKRGCCLILLLLIIFIIGLVVTVIARPPFTWNILKQFLNDDFNPSTVENYTAEQTLDFVNSSITPNGEGQIKLNETQITSLFRDRLGEDKDIRVEFEADTLRVVADLDAKEEVPLWLIVEFKEQTDQSLKMNKVGFGRFGLPEFVNNLLNSIVLNLINVTQGDISGNQSAEGIINALLQTGVSEKLEVTEVKFIKDELQISYVIKE